MYELFNILDRYGIVAGRDLLKIANLPAKKIENLHSDLFNHIFQAQNAKIWAAPASANDAFSFLASASIRGASGCGSIDCIGPKLDFLGRYAALYASELTFPLRMMRPKSDQRISVLREWLSYDLFSLLLLRPAITGKIIVPVVMRSQHCVHEIGFVEKTKKLVHSYSQAVARDVLSEFHLVYQVPEKSPSGLPTLYLKGPEEYIEHGGLLTTFKQPPSWLPTTGRCDKEGMMEFRSPHKLHMVAELFANIADNMTFYLAYGLKRRARLLSDMPGETGFLELINGNEQMTAKSLALSQLEHSVPVLADLSIASILRIRKQEQDSFEAYRERVTRISDEILAANKNVTVKQAHEMFRDAIKPELDKMTKGITAYRRVRRSQVLGGMAAIAAGVLIGAYAGLPTVAALPAAALGTMVGGRLLSKAAEAACEHGPEFKQKNDLYFLLKLTQET